MRLAMALGRHDWEQLLEEMTPRQVAVWQVAEQVQPWGERRADVRAAMNTLLLIQEVRAGNGHEVPRDTAVEIIKALTTYATEEQDEVASPEEVAAILMTASRGKIKPVVDPSKIEDLEQWHRLAISSQT